MFGEAFDEKYLTKTNKPLIAEATRYMMDRAPEPVQAGFKQACQNVLSAEHRGHIEAAYGFHA